MTGVVGSYLDCLGGPAAKYLLPLFHVVEDTSLPLQFSQATHIFPLSLVCGMGGNL
jgi:hypothetical protein